MQDLAAGSSFQWDLQVRNLPLSWTAALLHDWEPLSNIDWIKPSTLTCLKARASFLCYLIYCLGGPSFDSCFAQDLIIILISVIL